MWLSDPGFNEGAFDKRKAVRLGPFRGKNITSDELGMSTLFTAFFL